MKRKPGSQHTFSQIDGEAGSLSGSENCSSTTEQQKEREEEKGEEEKKEEALEEKKKKEEKKKWEEEEKKKREEEKKKEEEEERVNNMVNKADDAHWAGPGHPLGKPQSGSRCDHCHQIVNDDTYRLYLTRECWRITLQQNTHWRYFDQIRDNIPNECLKRPCHLWQLRWILHRPSISSVSCTGHLHSGYLGALQPVPANLQNQGV